jgi:hypothetical protein
MAFDAMITSSDSLNPSALLDCSENERPPVFVTAMGQGYLDEELDTARQDWIYALRKIPGKPGARRNAAIAKEQQLKKHYERLLGHPVGQPFGELPMDALPHVTVEVHHEQ